jgi:hypothetical protein
VGENQTLTSRKAKKESRSTQVVCCMRIIFVDRTLCSRVFEGLGNVYCIDFALKLKIGVSLSNNYKLNRIFA